LASKKKASKSDDDLDVQVGPAVERYRKDRGWSIQQLAREAGVSAGTVHKVEKETMVPSIAVLLKIARALGRPVSDFVADGVPEASERFKVFRAQRRPRLNFAELPVQVRTMAGMLPDRQLDAGVYEVDRGGSLGTEPVSHPGEKLYYVLEGKVRFEVGDSTLNLVPGDALHLKSDLPHRWENGGDEVARFFFVTTPPLGVS
jgi:transcriptional regulator with XRE-family HTH domain